MNNQTFCSWLTPRVERRATGQEGKGVYAVQPLAKDECIWTPFGLQQQDVLAHPQESLRPGAQVASHLLYAYLSIEELGGESFRHSCNPNAGFRGIAALVALRPIVPEERITFDYAMCLPDNFGQMTCQCGALTCRKVITGQDWNRPELQLRYQGYFLSFVEEKIRQGQQRGEAYAQTS
jgi:hypothetical protein